MLGSLPLVPLICAILIAAVPRQRAAAALAIGALLVTTALALTAAASSRTAAGLWWGSNLAPQLALTGFARVMCVLVPSIATIVTLYAAGAPKEERGSARLLALLVAFTGAMELLVIAGDFLTLLIGWELVGACSWALIGYEWRDVSRVRSARNAFIVTRSGDLGLYLAAAAAFSATGSLRFDVLPRLHAPLLGVVTAGIVVAAVAKSAQLPFAPWLFSAMAGPTPASALLHSATMVAAGAYLLARLAPVLSLASWFGPVVATIGIATALSGGVVASLQSDLKKALAASTSAQYGLMFVAIGAGFPGAADVHLVAHAVFKALLFLGAGVALHAAGTLDLERLRKAQLGHVLPRVMVLYAAGTLALAGAPPLGAAFSKEQIIAAAGRAPFLAGGLEAAVLLAALLSAFYAARLQLLGFARGNPGSADGSHIARPSGAEMASLAMLALTCVALGVVWIPTAQRMFERVSSVVLAPARIADVPLSIGLAVFGMAAAWLLSRRGHLATLRLSARWRQAEDWLGIPTLGERGIVRPTLAFARLLAIVDDRAVDAGIRATARVASIASRTFAWWGERGVDRIVNTVAQLTGRAAQASSRVDDAGIDGAVERVARDVGRIGDRSRELQSGLAHWYYVLVMVGTLAALMIAAASVVLRGR